MSSWNGDPGWPRILGSGSRARAVERVEVIGRALIEAEPLEGSSLFDGRAGAALFFAYASRLPELRDAWSVEAPFHLGLEAAPGREPRPLLFGGSLGIGWVAAHLPELRAEAGELLGRIDVAVAEHLAEAPDPVEWDLFNGLVGIGVYLLERLPEPRAADALPLLGVRLWNAARRLDAGVSWYRTADLIPADSRVAFPRGHFDLGISHGVSGVIAFLSSMIAAERSDEDARELLETCIPWLLSHRRPGSARSFPSFVTWTESGWSGISAGIDRLYGDPGWESWAYGDLSRGLALLEAARWTGHRPWAEVGLGLALDAWRRSDGWRDRIPADLVEGSAGLAQLCARLHQATGQPDFLEASRSLFEHTLDRLERGEEDGWAGWSFGLAGLAGVGLALVSACEPTIEPEWDRLLLMSPPRGSSGNRADLDGGPGPPPVPRPAGTL